MTEITLPSEVIKKVIEAMANDMLKDGLTWSLRTAVEDELKRRIAESGVVDKLADEIITYVLSNQNAIVEHIGGQFIEVVGDSLATVYREVAQAIARKVKW